MKRKAFSRCSLFIISFISLGQKPGSVLQVAAPETAGFSSERLKRIDENLNAWMSDGRLNGGVALIARNGKIVYHKAFGYDDLQKTKPMKPDMIFRIASQTKAKTSVAVMILYEEGRFLLDDSVSKYIPEFAKRLMTMNQVGDLNVGNNKIWPGLWNYHC